MRPGQAAKRHRDSERMVTREFTSATRARPTADRAKLVLRDRARCRASHCARFPRAEQVVSGVPLLGARCASLLPRTRGADRMSRRRSLSSLERPRSWRWQRRRSDHRGRRLRLDPFATRDCQRAGRGPAERPKQVPPSKAGSSPCSWPVGFVVSGLLPYVLDRPWGQKGDAWLACLPSAPRPCRAGAEAGRHQWPNRLTRPRVNRRGRARRGWRLSGACRGRRCSRRALRG